MLGANVAFRVSPTEPGPSGADAVELGLSSRPGAPWVALAKGASGGELSRIMLAVQVVLIAVLCLFVVPRLTGQDYDAAVMSGGFCGFMLGTTANAVANMGALVERYGATRPWEA